ncbi:MAG: hypothetical protein IJI35_00380 [Kiritimatiellae bacterium]|nr:hypothetical protein [Kiritimatiellia bacterium]
MPVLPGPGRSCGSVTDGDLSFSIMTIPSSELLGLRRGLDERVGGKTPVVVDTPTVGLVVPRVAPDGSLRSVAFVNARMDFQKRIRMRLRGVPPGADVATWWALREKPVSLPLVRKDGETLVEIPSVSAWNCGWLAIAPRP